MLSLLTLIAVGQGQNAKKLGVEVKYILGGIPSFFFLSVVNTILKCNFKYE